LPVAVTKVFSQIRVIQKDLESGCETIAVADFAKWLLGFQDSMGNPVKCNKSNSF